MYWFKRPTKPKAVLKSLDGIIRLPAKSAARLTGRRQTIIILVAIMLVVTCTVVLLIGRNGPAGLPDDTLGSVKVAVGRHYVLPTNEEPALATVTDKNKLTSALRDKAENGDKLLIYQQNRQAVLYRPSLDRIIEVAPVVIDVPKNGVQ